MKSLKEQIMDKCKHFNGTMNKKCDVGVAYETVREVREPGRGFKLPCLLECDNCSKRELVTEAEADVEIEEHKKRFEGTMLARKAIVDFVGPWKKGQAARGRISCPVCRGEMTLQFSRAGVNGHIHARCSTPDCVSWME